MVQCGRKPINNNKLGGGAGDLQLQEGVAFNSSLVCCSGDDVCDEIEARARVAIAFAPNYSIHHTESNRTMIEA